MSNENFGLSFTTQGPAIWKDDTVGKIGLESTILYPFELEYNLENKIGLEGTVFFPYPKGLPDPKIGLEATILVPYGPGTNKIGLETVVSASGLCAKQNKLSSGPSANLLSGPGTSLLSLCGQ